MTVESSILLSQANVSVSDSTFSYGERSKGPGYHRKDNALQTSIFDFSDFTGTVKLQATLALDPTNSDWFDIDSTEFVGDQSNSTQLFNFYGNFVWIRAAYNVQSGSINEIRYNY